MCFTDSSDSICLATKHVLVRKQRRCYDCGGDILPGTLAQRYAWACEGSVSSGDICERCQWLVARIYAEERAEGCGQGESWPSIGGGMLEDEYRERTWYLRKDADE